MTSDKSMTTDEKNKPFLHFLHVEAAGGVALLVCMLIALFFANSAFATPFLAFWQTPVAISVGSLSLTHSIQDWINDGLMTIFFFVIGLEIKRELVAGELKNKQAAILPLAAAFGGMLLPASVYILALGQNQGTAGWGIPMATDIAFVVGFLSLFGKRVPKGLKIFILSLAIADDLGAIIVIAAVYSSNISLVALTLGCLGLGLTMLLNRLGVRRVPIYVFVGTLIWFAFLFSGVHPTIAGVLLGLLTPASAWIGDKAFLDVVSKLAHSWNGEKTHTSYTDKGTQINHLIVAARETVSPLQRLELALHPWVAFFIMPVFALANAGVPIVHEAITSPVSVAVSLGLLIGKPLGILLFSWLSVNFLGAKLPTNTSWNCMVGTGFLAGIGFTMSIFIANLAFTGDMLVAGKVGAITGSFISATVGLMILYYVLPQSKADSTDLQNR